MDKFNTEENQEFTRKFFDEWAVFSIAEYIKIPNLSRSYDPDWDKNGLLIEAAEHIKKWIQGIKIKGLKTQIIKDEGYSPIIFTQIPGTIPTTLLFYGHFDKQPPFTGWNQGLGATSPMIIDDKLYGRGGADDGYSTYGTMIAIKSVIQQKLPIPRCVMITEGDEESGSAHLLHYLDKLKNRIGQPSVIFCLDSGTIDYDRFWLTNSLRGNLVATLRVQALKQGVHSGDASGIVPSPYRIANLLLNRIQNIQTGHINDVFHVHVPANRYQENHRLAQIKGKQAVKQFPFVKGVHPISGSQLQLLLNGTWKPTLTVIGKKQYSQAEGSGNVLLPAIELRFSLRLPPTLDANRAVQDVKQMLTYKVPYGAHVQVKNIRAAKGWNAPQYDQYLQKLVEEASLKYYKNQWLALGEGGSIPIMGKFSQLWPKAQFIITGVLGPASNAHGPNEFLHLQYTRKLISCMAHIVAGVSVHYKPNEQKKQQVKQQQQKIQETKKEDQP